jgi:hypothetical protein
VISASQGRRQGVALGARAIPEMVNKMKRKMNTKSIKFSLAGQKNYKILGPPEKKFWRRLCCVDIKTEGKLL